MDQAQIQVKLVVEETTTSAGGKFQTKAGTVAARRNVKAGTVKADNDPANPSRSDKPSPGKASWLQNKLSARDPGVSSRLASTLRRVEPMLNALSASETAGTSFVKTAAPVLTSAAILAGGAKIIEEVVPRVLAAVNEALGLDKTGAGKKITDMISEKISEAFTSLSAILPALGQTKDLLTAQLRLGGAPNFKYAEGVFEGVYFVEQQRQQLDARFKREIGIDFTKQLTRAAMGRGG